MFARGVPHAMLWNKQNTHTHVARMLHVRFGGQELAKHASDVQIPRSCTMQMDRSMPVSNFKCHHCLGWRQAPFDEGTFKNSLSKAEEKTPLGIFYPAGGIFP